MFRRSLPGRRRRPGPTVVLKLDQRPRHHLAFDLRLTNVSLPVLHAACDPVLAQWDIPFTLHMRLRVLQPHRPAFTISVHPQFRCDRDNTGAVHALSVVTPKRRKLGPGLSLRARPSRLPAAGARGTLAVTVGNTSRSIPAQDIIVSAYLPVGMHDVGRPRGTQVLGRREIWCASKLRRRRARSLRVGVASARAGRRCVAISAEAALRRRTSARACVAVGRAEPTGHRLTHDESGLRPEPSFGNRWLRP